jgi:hypothetical protein
VGNEMEMEQREEGRIKEASKDVVEQVSYR